MNYNFIDNSGDRDFFTIVPNYVINHSTLEQQGLYLYMKRKAGENGLCFATEETMCKSLEIGKDKLHKVLDYLLSRKWITFVGRTKGKTRPVNTYRINQIWNLNSDYYKKKIPSISAVSQAVKKDTAVLGGKIPPSSDGIRRTNNKEEPINKQHEAKASGLKSIGSLMEKYKIPEKKTGGAFYSWQDQAVRWWEKMKIAGKPSSSWFKIFKQNSILAERACSFSIDSDAKDLERMTYWAFNSYMKTGVIMLKTIGKNCL